MSHRLLGSIRIGSPAVVIGRLADLLFKKAREMLRVFKAQFMSRLILLPI